MIDRFLDDLGDRLDAHAVASTKEWWERYLKGAVPFRGVKMADTRGVVRRMWADYDLDGLGSEGAMDVALACFGRPHCEDKLAGVLLLAEHLLGALTDAHVARLAEPLAQHQITDWNTCDWYGVKVLGPFILAGEDRHARAESVAGWRTAGVMWQRRAAAVAFVNLAPHGDTEVPGLTDLVLAVCEANVADPTRWSQTSVGWVLRELSHAEPDRVRAFVEAHPAMSSEARTTALAKLTP